MPHDYGSSQDVASIREWLSKESYLPTDFDDLVIRKFLHSCYGSLEKTKKCMDRFCTTRSAWPEAYSNRDPLSPKIQTAFSISYIVTYKMDDDQELLIHQIDDPGLEKLNFYDLVKAFTIQADYWMLAHDFLPSGHVIIFDMKDISLKILTKINLMFFKDFLVFLLEAMPVRLKEVHAVNCPSYYEKLYALIKPVLPNDICEIINFHSSVDGLHKFIQKKHLPVEYGGEARSIQEEQKSWTNLIAENKDIFLKGNLWMADLSKKPKSNAVESAMSGSFRTLSID